MTKVIRLGTRAEQLDVRKSEFRTDGDVVEGDAGAGEGVWMLWAIWRPGGCHAALLVQLAGAALAVCAQAVSRSSL